MSDPSPTPKADAQFVEVVRAYQERRVLFYLAVVNEDETHIGSSAGFMGRMTASRIGEVAAAASGQLGVSIAQVLDALPPHAAELVKAAIRESGRRLDPKIVEYGGTVVRRDRSATNDEPEKKE